LQHVTTRVLFVKQMGHEAMSAPHTSASCMVVTYTHSRGAQITGD